ncbi:MAG: hypothetical protein ACREHD_01285, partial [Pirellulales bacterium]
MLGSIVWFIIAHSLLPVLAADDETQPPEAEKRAADSRETVTRIAEGYQLFMGDDRVPLSIERDPVLR